MQLQLDKQDNHNHFCAKRTCAMGSYFAWLCYG